MKFVDLKRQYHAIEPELRRRIDTVIAHGKFILGPEVTELEDRLATFVGVNHCLGVANGTDALQLCLRALGIGSGHAVFVPTFTFVATAEAVSQVGATPIFVDVIAETFNMDPASLDQAIVETQIASNLKPKAAIIVDLFGLPADYESLESVLQRHDLDLIEDGAQSLGGRIRRKLACSFGRMSTTSFFPAKPLGCYGDGGAIFTDDDELIEVLRSLRVHGKGSHKYDNERVGLNSRLDTLQAAILLAKLDVFENELIRRNEISAYYTHALEDNFDTPVIPDGYQSAWAQYTLMAPAGERKHIRQNLQEHGIPTAIYYPKPLHLQTVYQENAVQTVSLPVSEMLCDRVFSIPVHPYLKDEECEKVVESLRTCLRDE